ncbi:hypothetical protein BC831DRAFT_268871 [Entophlyctis helioformis]|nr:hypothetical protein BC831DRAFT_268871 [Entophlyctis helioformis]
MLVALLLVSAKAWLAGRPVTRWPRWSRTWRRSSLCWRPGRGGECPCQRTADQVHRDVDTGLQRLTETLDTRLDSTEARSRKPKPGSMRWQRKWRECAAVTERLAEHATLSADRDAQHKEIVSTLKDLLHAQVSSLSLRLDDITPEIARLDTKADGILSSVSQSITAHTAATDKSIADLRKTVATKLTASDHDRYKSEAQQQADKLAAKQEISMLAIDQVRLRLGDNEAVAKQRWQAVLDSQTRSTADAMDALKGVRETLGARLSDLETRVLDDIPRVLDDCRAETRRCTTDTRDTALGLHELAKQVQRLDDRRGGDTDTAAITGVVSTVRALDDRLGRLAADIADLRSDMERLRLRVRSPSPHRGRDHAVVRDSPPPPQPPPQQPQSSFYKPVLRTYSQRVLDGTASPPPWPASGSSTKSQPMLARAGSPPPADPGPTSQSQSQSRSQSPPVQPSLPGNLRRLPSPPTEY